MRFFTVLALLMLISSPAYSQEAWMKRENMNELGLYTNVGSDCPFSNAEIKDLADGEFLRARISPIRSLDFNLNITVHCMVPTNSSGTPRGNVVFYEIRYGTQIGPFENVLYETPDYGSMMIGGTDSKQYFLDNIREDINEALTDYLRANM